MSPEMISVITDLGGWGMVALIAWQLVQAIREQAAAAIQYQAEVAHAIERLAERVDENNRQLHTIGGMIADDYANRPMRRKM